jgi:predicted kinase
MAGLPCTGKSTIANAIATTLPASLLSADPIDVALSAAGQPNEQGKAGYEVMKAITREHLMLGLHVVVDAVNPFAFVRRAYLDLAAQFVAPTAVIMTTCSDRDLHRTRVEQRHVAGRKGIDWTGVEKQIAYFEPQDGEALTLDATVSPLENITKAIAYAMHRGLNDGRQ